MRRQTVQVLSMLLLACAGLVGCQSASTPATEAPAAAPATAKPKVDKLVMGITFGTEANDPRTSSQQALLGLRRMHEFLVGLDPTNGKLAPELATTWKLEESAASAAFRFTLRKDVPFHRDQGVMTAQDAVLSYENRTQPDATSQTSLVSQQIVASVEATGEHELLVRLKQPDPRFLGTAAVGWEVISKKHSASMGGKVPGMLDQPVAGTGPYRMRERSQGAYIRYERAFEKHWRVNPDFPNFEFRFIPEESTRLAALLAKEIHLAPLGKDTLASAEQAGMKVIAATDAQDRIFVTFWCCYQVDGAFNHPDSPLLDVRVRKALAKSVNRYEINKAFFRGRGKPMEHAVLYPTDAAWNPAWKDRFTRDYGFDLEEARRLLRDAGYDATKPVKLSAVLSNRFPGSNDITEALMARWRSIGAEVEALQLDSARQRAMGRALQFTNQLYVSNTSLDTFTAISSYYTPYSARLGYEDADAVRVFDELQKTLDQQKLDGLLRRWGDIAYDKYLAIPLVLAPVEIAVNGDIVGGYPFPGTLIGAYSHVEHIKAAP